MKLTDNVTSVEVGDEPLPEPVVLLVSALASADPVNVPVSDTKEVFPNEVNRVAGVEAGRETFPIWVADPLNFEAVSPTVETRSSVNRRTESLVSIQDSQ